MFGLRSTAQRVALNFSLENFKVCFGFLDLKELEKEEKEKKK